MTFAGTNTPRSVSSGRSLSCPTTLAGCAVYKEDGWTFVESVQDTNIWIDYFNTPNVLVTTIIRTLTQREMQMNKKTLCIYSNSTYKFKYVLTLT